ncbi:MAG: amidohydrolase family protein [Burkholderiales bacterium]
MAIIVDSNIHVIAPPQERQRYPLDPLAGTEDEWSEEHTMTPAKFVGLSNAAGLQQAYLMASRFHGFDNSYCADAVAQYPNHFVGVANIDIFEADAADKVSYWIEERGMHGVRFWGGGRGTCTWVNDAKFTPAWERVRSLGVPSNAHTTKPPALPATRLFLDRFGGIPFTINYMGHVPVDEGAGSQAARDLFALAAYPNVYVNFPVDFVEAAAQALSPARDLMMAMLEHFGARRMLWSSFYPSQRQRTLQANVEVMRTSLSYLDATDIDWILGGAARELYPTLKKGMPN